MPLGRTPFTDANIQKQAISEIVHFIDWTSCPLPKRLGITNEDMWDFLNWPPGNSKKFEWMQDTLAPVADALDGSVNASQTVFTVDNGDYFHTGQVLEVESEYVIVDDVSGDTLTVVRAQGGTSAATHSDNTVVTVVGIAKKTGANYSIGYTTSMTLEHNFTQIMEESVRVNRDQKIASDYGVPDTMAYHLAKLIGGNSMVGEKGRAGTLFLRLCDMAYKGKRQQPTNSIPGMAGGLDHYITTNVNGSTSTALERDDIEGDLDTSYLAGGIPNLIVTGPYGARKLESMFEGFRTYERSEKMGGGFINMIRTPVIDEVEVLVDWKCPNTKLYILDSSKVGWVTVRPFDIEEKPSLGDYDVFSVLGEYSFVVANETVHAIRTYSSSL